MYQQDFVLFGLLQKGKYTYTLRNIIFCFLKITFFIRGKRLRKSVSIIHAALARKSYSIKLSKGMDKSILFVI